jgi:shikimate dehydrogenase
VLVLGLGGAGTAVAAALAERGLAGLALWDRNLPHTRQLAARLQAGAACPLRAMEAPDPEGFDLVVHCTSLGLYPDDPLPFDVARLRPDAAVVDILMKPEPTPLQRACERRGITCSRASRC